MTATLHLEADMNITPIRSPDDWAEIGHYYEPIPYYRGKVLKYAGIACRMNHEDMMSKPGVVMLDAYKGDRITSDTHTLFTGL